MNYNYSDLEVPVPYGIIAAKVWSANGDTVKTEEAERFIALHGWQDNCGTFDNLIPLIQKRIVVVAIDLPGHGLSSHFPPGCPYSDLTYAMDIKRVADFLDWNSFSLLGHSMGGYVSIFFAALFPRLVKRVVSLDIVKPLTFKADELAKSTAKGIETFLDTELRISNTTATPTYKEDELLARLIEGHTKLGLLSREGAATLLKRGSRKLEGTEDYVFTRDPRLRALLFTRLDTVTVQAYLKTLSCELLIVKAKDGILLDSEDTTKSFLDLYGSVCKRFEYVVTEGHHHFHLCTAELAAPPINDFLSEVDSGDVDQLVAEGELLNENSKIVTKALSVSNGQNGTSNGNGCCNGDKKQNGNAQRVIHVDDVI